MSISIYRTSDAGAMGQAMRRMVGMEREYRCSAGHEHRSWTRLHACPDCGEALAIAVIRRAALTPAA
jgi:hypothetical protein